jgi:hypothetical protein
VTAPDAVFVPRIRQDADYTITACYHVGPCIGGPRGTCAEFAACELLGVRCDKRRIGAGCGTDCGTCPAAVAG